MGYTHYFKTQKYKFSRVEFAKVKTMVSKILQTAGEAPWRIETEIEYVDENNFYFNGIEDEECETMCVHREWPDVNFCKTGYKPYDTCVTACLLLLNLVSKGAITLSSDGDRVDWLDGFKLLNQSLPGIYSQYAQQLPESEFNFALTDKEITALKLRTKLDLKGSSHVRKKALLLFTEASLSKLSLFKVELVPIIQATPDTLNIDLVSKVRELAETGNTEELEITLPHLLQEHPLLADSLYLAALTNPADVVAILVPDQAKVIKRLITISKQQTVIQVDLDLETTCAACFYPRLVNYNESMGTLEKTLTLIHSLNNGNSTNGSSVSGTLKNPTKIVPLQ